MSQLFHIYAAHEEDAAMICDHPVVQYANGYRYRKKCVSLIAFDQFKQLSLLGLVRQKKYRVPAPGLYPEPWTKAYFRQFKRLHPKFLWTRFVTKFPDDLVIAMAELSNSELTDLAKEWREVEPSFAQFDWSISDVKKQLTRVRAVSKEANATGQCVLFSWSL